MASPSFFAEVNGVVAGKLWLSFFVVKIIKWTDLGFACDRTVLKNWSDVLLLILF